MALSNRKYVGDLVVEEYTLDASEIALKEVTLSNSPVNPQAVLLDVQGGTSQRYMVDFQVIGNKLNWLGLGLEVQVGVGDYLRATYIS